MEGLIKSVAEGEVVIGRSSLPRYNPLHTLYSDLRLLVAPLLQHQAILCQAFIPGVSVTHSLFPVGLLFPIYSEVTSRNRLQFLVCFPPVCLTSIPFAAFLCLVKPSFSAQDSSLQLSSTWHSWDPREPLCNTREIQGFQKSIQ